MLNILLVGFGIMPLRCLVTSLAIYKVLQWFPVNSLLTGQPSFNAIYGMCVVVSMLVTFAYYVKPSIKSSISDLMWFEALSLLGLILTYCIVLTSSYLLYSLGGF